MAVRAAMPPGVARQTGTFGGSGLTKSGLVDGGGNGLVGAAHSASGRGGAATRGSAGGGATGLGGLSGGEPSGGRAKRGVQGRMHTRRQRHRRRRQPARSNGRRRLRHRLQYRFHHRYDAVRIRQNDIGRPKLRLGQNYDTEWRAPRMPPKLSSRRLLHHTHRQPSAQIMPRRSLRPPQSATEGPTPPNSNRLSL